MKLVGEERANVLTHLPGMIGTVAVAWPLMKMACGHDWTYILGTLLFIIGMLVMYTASTLYHLFPQGKVKRVARVVDHVSIYLMIAGSYSLICTSILGGWVGWSLFIFLWSCVLVGLVGKIFFLGKHPKLSLTLYLMMGWVALLVIWPLWKAMPHAAFFWVITEGVLYSIGSYFFSKDEEHAYYHAIWHVFILLGSLSHTVATWLVLMN